MCPRFAFLLGLPYLLVKGATDPSMVLVWVCRSVLLMLGDMHADTRANTSFKGLWHMHMSLLKADWQVFDVQTTLHSGYIAQGQVSLTVCHGSCSIHTEYFDQFRFNTPTFCLIAKPNA